MSAELSSRGNSRDPGSRVPRSTGRGGLARGLLLPALSVLVCASAAAQVTVVDAGGREVRIGDASRVLSIGGDVTEIVYALGAGSRVTAVDTTSQFPPQALEKTKVGYLRALSSEGVISVGATLVLASASAGPPEVVRTLKSTSVPYVEVPADYTPDGIVKKIRLIARALGAEAEGEQLARKVTAGFEALAALRARIKRPVRALFVLGVQNGRLLVGGKGTSAHAMLVLAGAENAAAGTSGFRPVADEAVVELAPEVIVGMRSSGDDDDAHDLSGLLSLKGVQSTPAGAGKRLVLMDRLYLLGFGPRAADAARDLMQALYPEIAAGSAKR